MKLSSIIDQYLPNFLKKYSTALLPSHLKAIDAIGRCRTPDAGEVVLSCNSCGSIEHCPRSCGNRNCPQCQNHEASKWLERQKAKLLPVEYFMVTFTLPAELRGVAWRNQSLIYNTMFSVIASTLKDFGLNPKFLGADIGMTAILHTHTRQLDYHPHIHVIVPGGGADKSKRQWITKPKK